MNMTFNDKLDKLYELAKKQLGEKSEWLTIDGDECVYIGGSGYMSVKGIGGFYEITRGCNGPVDTNNIERDLDKLIEKLEGRDNKPKEIVIDGVRYVRQ